MYSFAQSLVVPVVLVLTLIVNGLAATGGLNGVPTGAISDAYPTYFTPATYVFGIWSLIYTLLIGFALYQLAPSVGRQAGIGATRMLLALNLLLNSGWLLAWQYEYFALSVGLMIGILLTLIGVYQSAEVGTRTSSLAAWLFGKAPFSVYLGWISVATIANISVYLTSIHWDRFGVPAVVWSMAMMGVAGLLGVLALHKSRDYLYASVIVWALVGIAVKHMNKPSLVATAMIVCIFLMIAAFYRRYSVRV